MEIKLWNPNGNQINDTIEKLSKNNIEKLTIIDVTIGVIQAIAEALESNTSLTEINLFNNRFGDDGIQAIAKALKGKTSLTELNFSGNWIDHVGTQALVETLKSNTSLTMLDLSHNQIDNIGAQAIAEALKSNTSLTELYLNSNFIGDAGAQAFAEALKDNTSLNWLNLSDNPIGNTDAQALEESLIQNIWIMSIGWDNMTYNSIRCFTRNQDLKTSRERRARSLFSAMEDPSTLIFEGRYVYREVYRRLQKAMVEVDYNRISKRA